MSLVSVKDALNQRVSVKGIRLDEADATNRRHEQDVVIIDIVPITDRHRLVQVTVTDDDVAHLHHDPTLTMLAPNNTISA